VIGHRHRSCQESLRAPGSETLDQYQDPRHGRATSR
jgi:hypothetical protein